MPEELQRLLGYHRFGLGVDSRDPIDVINDEIYVHETAKLAKDWYADYQNKIRESANA